MAPATKAEPAMMDPIPLLPERDMAPLEELKAVAAIPTSEVIALTYVGPQVALMAFHNSD